MLKTQTSSKTAPGIRQRIPLPYGPFGQLLREPLGFHVNAAGDYGDVVRVQIGPKVHHLLTHPDHVNYVFHEKPKNFPRPRLAIKLMRRVARDGLLAAEGDSWRRRRVMLQPAFHPNRLRAYVPLMSDVTSRVLQSWQRPARDGRPIDMMNEMMRVTLCVVVQALFSRDAGGETDAVFRSVWDVTQYIDYRAKHWFGAPLFIPTARNQLFKRAMAALDELVYRMIAERRAEDSPPDDLFTALIMARDEESGEQMTDRQIRDEIVTFLGAGYSTTSLALTWTWILLSRHPGAAHLFYQEVDELLGGRVPTFEDVEKLQYTRMIFEEAMRLYPPVWITARQAVADDEIGGYRIPAKSTVVICPYVTHRHPDFWPHADAFRPERFAPEHAAKQHRFAYFPFGGGPHVCPGKGFAMVEGVLVMAMMAQRFRAKLVGSRGPRPRAVFVGLQPQGEVLMRIREREQRSNDQLAASDRMNGPHSNVSNISPT